MIRKNCSLFIFTIKDLESWGLKGNVRLVIRQDRKHFWD